MRPVFQYTCDPPTARLRIAGELDIADADDLTDIFGYLDFRGCERVEVDLGAITFVDAYILGLLRHEQERLRTLGGDLLPVAASPWYTSMCHLARYDTLQVPEQPPTFRVLHEARHLCALPDRTA
jgi:anti-anti-sigma regulatory factor